MKANKIIFGFWLTTIALCLVVREGFSQPDLLPGKKISMNLSSMLKLAGANNLTIKQYELQYELSLAQLDKAKEWYLPVISLGPTMHYLTGAVMQTNGQLLTDATQKELWLGGGIVGEIDFKNGIYNTKAEKQQSEAVKFMGIAERNNLILQAISDYYDLMVAQFDYTHLNDLLHQSDTLIAQIKVQVDAGIRYQSEYLLAQSNYNHISVEVTDAKLRMQKNSSALLNILNLDSISQLISSDTALVPINNLTPDLNTPSDAKSRPEYKSMQADLNAIEDEKKSTTTGLLLPKLEVGNSNALLGTFGEPYYSSYRLDAGLLWDIPIGRIIYKGDLKTYNAEINMEQNSMDQFSNDARQQVEDAKAQLKFSKEQMTNSQQELSQSAEALTQSEQREKLGTVLPFEVFQSEEFYVQAEKDFLEAVGNYNKAQYSLYVALGNNL